MHDHPNADDNGATLVAHFELAVSRLAAVARELAEAKSSLEVALRTRRLGPIPACTHADGHQLELRSGEALSIEASRDCPCCGARLWISLPSVGALLESAALDDGGIPPGLDVDLTQRERQVLSVLRRSRYPLRADQLAALIWSDPHRTHDVRSVLYRLRRKLRNSPWTIPVAGRDGRLRLITADDDARPDDTELEFPRGLPESHAA